MRVEREIVLKELSHPDPLQQIFAAVWLIEDARKDYAFQRLNLGIVLAKVGTV